MYGRFDIGLKLLSSSGSAVGFFKMGVNGCKFRWV